MRLSNKSDLKLIESSEQLETSAQKEVDVEKRLLHFRNVLQTNSVLSEFDCNVFESVVEKVIMGEEQENGSVEPYFECPHLPDNSC